MITIIILSFNTQELTVRAVHSCLEGRYKDIRVVVVDNNSSDDTVSALKTIEKKDSRLEVIARTVNDGFSKGNNIALSKVTSEFCMLLNSDAHIDEGSDLEELVSYMKEHSDVGMVTPHVVLGNGKTDPASHRGFPTPWNAFTYFTGLEKLMRKSQLFGGYHQTWKDLSTIHEVGACTGAAMFVRTNAMKEVGLLDEQFFMYGEDLDWCYRFEEKGWKVIFHPSVIVHHDKHTSGIKKTKHVGKNEQSKQIQQRSRDAFYDAMKLFYKKHYAHVYPSFLQSLTFFGISVVRKIKGH